LTKIVNVLGVAQNKGQSIYNNVRWQRYISIHMPFMRLGIRTRWISDREYDMLLRSCHHFILLYELRHDIAEILLIKIKLALNTNQSINLYELFILPLLFFFLPFLFRVRVVSLLKYLLWLQRLVRGHDCSTIIVYIF
jgi:hypothetical protein